MNWKKIFVTFPVPGLSLPPHFQLTVTLPLTPRKISNSVVQKPRRGMGSSTPISSLRQSLESIYSLHILLLISMEWADAGRASAELLFSIWSTLEGKRAQGLPGAQFSQARPRMLAHKCLTCVRCVDWEVLLTPHTLATSLTSSFTKLYFRCQGMHSYWQSGVLIHRVFLSLF